MKIRPVLTAVTVAGALLVAGAAPALAWSGPPVPAGCSFDQGTGVLTCSTTTPSTITAGPFSGVVSSGGKAGGGNVGMVGGFTIDQICAAAGHSGDFTELVFGGMTFTESVAITTTTERHGLHGKVFQTSTSSSPPSLVSVQGDPSCGQSL